MDSNPYLLCFENGVYDFKTNEFRQGYPSDYITKSTGRNYIKYDENNQKLKKLVSALLLNKKIRFKNEI